MTDLTRRILVFFFVLTTLHVLVTGHSEQQTDERKNLVERHTGFDQKLKVIDRKLRKAENGGGCNKKDTPVIVFLARLMEPAYGTIASKAIVKFEQVKENAGYGYNKFSGIFTAPVKGLYHFTASARQSRSGYLHLGLFKNYDEMAVSVGMNYNSLTISVSLTLEERDSVYVKNIWGRASGIVGGGQSYFSGHLVHRI